LNEAILRLPQIVIVDDEELAKSCSELLPEFEWICRNNVDYSALTGRSCVVVGRASAVCGSELGVLAKRLTEAGAGLVKTVAPEPNRPSRWGIDNGLDEGWDKGQLYEWLKANATEFKPKGSKNAAVTPRNAVIVTMDELAERRKQLAKARRDASPLFNLWKEWGLQLSEIGGPIPNLRNAVTILELDPVYAKTIWFDEFLGRVLTGEGRQWADADDIAFALHMQGEIGITRIGVETASRAVLSIAHSNIRNCVKDWLNSLVHDSTQRIESFFSDYFGAEQSDYCVAASRNFWLSLAARILEPGCKVDNMIVLEGPQGVGKSKALKLIGGEHFTEQHESATNPKAFAEILQGKILVEISEMGAFSRAEVNHVKQTISCPSDRYRDSYGRHASDHPRTCIFVGTTNRDDWNKDETGARRFWPIECNGEIDLAGIAANREQLFAEAAARIKAGEHYWEMPSEATSSEQRARYEHDSWTEEIEHILKGRTEITTHEILKELGIETARQDRSSQIRVGTTLRFLGWKRYRKRAKAHVGRPYLYFAPEDGDGK
jgi:predicted P-loop ATPase